MVEILAPAILKRVTGSFLDGGAIDVTFMFIGFNVVRIERSRKCLINYKNITSNYRYHIIKGLVKKYRGGWAGAERGWVISF